jgi:hypothetical protein
MPIIIFGTRGINSTLDSGDFNCPRCEEVRPYCLKQNRPFLTLFFLPIFPVGGATRYIECQGCGTAFKEEVLQYEPPSEGQRILTAFYRELQGGASLESVRTKLMDAGITPDRAEEIVVHMAEGRVKDCVCGQRYLASISKCGKCGASL